jgi:hypothetical protein
MRQMEDVDLEPAAKRTKPSVNQLARGSIVEVQRVASSQPEYQVCVRDGWEMEFDQALRYNTLPKRP